MPIRITTMVGCKETHCVKSVGVLFGVFMVRIKSECRKIGTRKNPNTDPFQVVKVLKINDGFSSNVVIFPILF